MASTPPSTPSEARPRAPAMTSFTREQVLRMTGITTRQISYWETLGLISPQWTRAGNIYSFADLVSLRTLKQLTEQGVPAIQIQGAIDALRRKMGGVEVPLSQLRIVPDGRSIAIQYSGPEIDPFSGQLALRFEPDGRVKVQPMPRPAEEWFAQALACEGKPELRGEAIEAYRHVIKAAPDWVEAHINLGTLLYERGDPVNAIKCYRKAIGLAPENALAQFNLGTVLDEASAFEQACVHLKEAVRLQPDFADAHYNLARVYEALGLEEQARAHWRRYLELDPSSSWAEHARQRLNPENGQA